MGKFVLGILAVIVLQIAFFGYMALDRSQYAKAPAANKIPELARSIPTAKPPSSTTPPIGDTVSEPADLKTHGAADRYRTTAKLRRDDGLRIRSPRAEVSRRAPLRPAYARQAPDYQPVPLKNVTITYRQYASATTDYLRPSEPESIVVAKQRKRPLLARVFSPVIKKPWRFMKAVASKLN